MILKSAIVVILFVTCFVVWINLVVISKFVIVLDELVSWISFSQRVFIFIFENYKMSFWWWRQLLFDFQSKLFLAFFNFFLQLSDFFCIFLCKLNSTLNFFSILLNGLIQLPAFLMKTLFWAKAISQCTIKFLIFLTKMLQLLISTKNVQRWLEIFTQCIVLRLVKTLADVLLSDAYLLLNRSCLHCCCSLWCTSSAPFWIGSRWTSRWLLQNWHFHNCVLLWACYCRFYFILGKLYFLCIL